MSENENNDRFDKLEGLIKSNRPQKIATYLSNAVNALLGLLSIYMITFIVDTSTKMSVLEINKVDKTMMIHYLTVNQYRKVEKQRSENVVNIVIRLGRIIGIKEEELQQLREKSIKELDDTIDLGTEKTK